MPHFASAIDQSSSLINLLQQSCKEHYSSDQRLLVPTPVHDPITSIAPDNLISLASSSFELDITVTKINTVSTKILAYCIRSSVLNHHKIYVTNTNPCWTRYYICKELSHLLVYSEENSTTTPADLEHLFSSIINTVNPDSPPILAEKIAYFTAIEMLVPTNIIPSLLEARKELEKLDAPHPDSPNLRIAKQLNVPERIIEFRLDNDQYFKDRYSESKKRLEPPTT